MTAVAAAPPGAPPPAFDLQAMSAFEAGLDGLAESDLMDEAEVDSFVREAILHAVGEAPWADSKVPMWTTHILEGVLKKLAGLQKPFKYVVHVSITQRAGAGLHAASSKRWNPKTDGLLSVHWESQTVLVLATVFWCAC